MKYRINLFSSDLKPKLELFSFSFVSVVWALVLVCVLGSFYVVYTKNAATQQLSTQYSDELAQLQAELSVNMQALQNLKPNKDLQLKVSELENTVQAQKLLLSKLGTLAEINSGDYAGLMQDLAAYRQPQVWLTQIHVEDRKVFLQGATINSQAIPQWLEKLSESQFFRGQHFEQAKIYRDQDDGLRFDIGTALTTVTPEAGK